MSTRQNYLPPGAAITAGAIIRKLDESQLMTTDVIGATKAGAIKAADQDWSFRPTVTHGTAGDEEPRPVCETSDPELFFSLVPRDINAAKALCLTCPRLGVCQTEAIDTDERYGVRGGLSEKERKAMRRRRKDLRGALLW